jgi:hypothetical protein
MSMPDDVWTEVGDRWERRLISVIADLVALNPGLMVRTGRDGNDRFALREWTSFVRRDTPGDEEIVISLDITTEVDGYRAQADIARGDGYVLAASAVETIVLSDDTDTLRANALKAMRSVETFLATNKELLSGELACGET